ncbi:MAG: MurR/RpiR family transcriptional regulator, partial [Clostridiales bacterium]|nr:MurR/RpiR family transcriptional regulator [Clostridiales bacterium]
MREGPSIMKQLNLRGKSLSKGHRKIAAFIEDNYDKVVFMTAARLGELVDISESTVVRFANACGYEGYPQMQRALREIVRHRLTSAQRLSLSTDIAREELPFEVLRTDMRNIKNTVDSLDRAVFDRVVEEIA